MAAELMVGEECFDPSREVVDVVQDFGFLGEECGTGFNVFQFALAQDHIGCVEQGATIILTEILGGTRQVG